MICRTKGRHRRDPDPESPHQELCRNYAGRHVNPFPRRRHPFNRRQSTIISNEHLRSMSFDIINSPNLARPEGNQPPSFYGTVFTTTAHSRAGPSEFIDTTETRSVYGYDSDLLKNQAPALTLRFRLLLSRTSEPRPRTHCGFDRRRAQSGMQAELRNAQLSSKSL